MPHAFPFSLPRLRRDEVGAEQGRRRACQSLVAPCLRWAQRTFGTQAKVEAHPLYAVLPEQRRWAEAGALYELSGAQGRAWLAIDTHLASTLLGQQLGVARPPLPLSFGERGLVAYALSGLLGDLAERLSLTLHLQTADSGARPADGVELMVGGAEPRGVLWLMVSPELASVLPARSSSSVRRLRELPFELGIIGGTLQLPLEELETLDPGDLVVSPDCPRSDPSQVVMCCGAARWIVEVSATQLTVIRRGEEMPSEELVTAKRLKLDVNVELARLRLNGGELLDLTPGDVISLERPLDNQVELRVADQLVARGELVDLDGEAAIRLTEVRR